MLGKSHAVSGFAVDDLEKAKEFYGGKLGIEIKILDEEEGLGELQHPESRNTLFYVKSDVEPANYTMLNFVVDDIDGVVDELSGNGVEFERYDGWDQDEKAIFRGREKNRGPDIAWFKDPAGNILSVLQDQ